VEIFLNYDCNLDNVDLFRKIVTTLAKQAKGHGTAANGSGSGSVGGGVTAAGGGGSVGVGGRGDQSASLGLSGSGDATQVIMMNSDRGIGPHLFFFFFKLASH
jgi:hypothetical protein